MPWRATGGGDVAAADSFLSWGSSPLLPLRKPITLTCFEGCAFSPKLRIRGSGALELMV